LSLRDRMRLWGKRLMFPGLDLHTRCRYRRLPKFFREGAIVTLDAGCGNAALCYAAYQPGNPKGSISLYRQCVKRPKGGAASDPANQAR